MFVYLKSEPGLWTVGHYTPAGKWVSESDHDMPGKAALRCAFLNGHGLPRDPPDTPAEVAPGARWVNDCGVIKLDSAADMYPQLFEATPGTHDDALRLAAAAPMLRDALRAVATSYPKTEEGEALAAIARNALETLDNG